MAIAGSLTYDTKIDKSGFEKGLSSLQTTTNTVGKQIKSIVTALGIDKLISTAFNVINSSIDGAISRIDTLNNFPKVMSNLGIASEDSEKAVKKLSDGLQGIPTTLDDASLSVQRFTSVNGDVDKSTEYFLALNNALLAGGASADIQTTAMEQLSQAYAKGKPDMIEWRSLQTAMPAQLKQVAEAFNMTTDELGEALRNGKISMNDFMDKIVELNKNGTGEFQSFEEQAKNSTGGIKTSIINVKTAITRGVTEITTAIDKALQNIGLGGLGTVISKIGSIAESVLKKVASSIPKVVQKIKDIYNWTNKNKEVLKALIKVIASVTAGYLAYKATLVAITAIQTAKKILGTVSAFLSLIPAIKSAKDMMLLLNMTFNANPIGLVVGGVTALTTALITFIGTQKNVNDTAESMSNGFKSFFDGIENAKSHLESFNSTLFASSEEQQKLQEEMDSVQNGITQICKTASDERRGYTQEEITQLDEYFNKLRELKNRELEIQQSISSAITQQAQQEAQAFEGSLEEYTVKSQEWIKTAEEQRDKQIEIINDGTIQQIALLNQRYKTEEERQSEAYQNSYNEIIRQKEEKIALANEEVAKVTEAYSNGYTERAKQNESWYTQLSEANEKTETENERHTNRLQEIEEKYGNSYHVLQTHTATENEKHKQKMKDIWNDMYKNMSEEEAKELGSWLARQVQVEMYGGKISDENQEMVDTILKSYDNMPNDAKEKMNSTMQGMLEGMRDKEPSLYAKASGIAGGILDRLKKSFDIHSPSKKTREIFNYVMEGAELGLEDEKNSLMKQIDDITDTVYRKMQNAIAIENASITAKATLEANKSQPTIIARDHTTTINNTQQFYSKESTPYEEQKQAKQQLRRLAYEL